VIARRFDKKFKTDFWSKFCFKRIFLRCRLLFPGYERHRSPRFWLVCQNCLSVPGERIFFAKSCARPQHRARRIKSVCNSSRGYWLLHDIRALFHFVQRIDNGGARTEGEREREKEKKEKRWFLKYPSARASRSWFSGWSFQSALAKIGPLLRMRTHDYPTIEHACFIGPAISLLLERFSSLPGSERQIEMRRLLPVDDHIATVMSVTAWCNNQH